MLLQSIISGEIPGAELEEIPLLTIILVLVFVIAGLRAKAVEALRKRTDELSRLLEISSLVTLTQEPESILHLILDYLKTVIAFESAAIYRLKEDILTVQAYQGSLTKEKALILRPSLENTLVGRQLLVNKEVVIIPDAWDDTPLA